MYIGKFSRHKIFDVSLLQINFHLVTIDDNVQNKGFCIIEISKLLQEQYYT